MDVGMGVCLHMKAWVPYSTITHNDSWFAYSYRSAVDNIATEAVTSHEL